MQNSFYKALETINHDESIALSKCLEHLKFNDQGLIPVVTQCNESKDVLMHAWMNLEAIKKTLETKRVTYWSRSRNKFWIKGEISGHTQELVNLFICFFDCVE